MVNENKIKMTFYCEPALRAKIVNQMTDPNKPGATMTEVCERNLESSFEEDHIFTDAIETLDETISLTEQIMRERLKWQRRFHLFVIACITLLVFINMGYILWIN